ncbi:MAG: 3,4-dehydroadipyl-CoA semialdehyde dehydrogenase [Planctomycetota bacterium]|nr:3,4-dehydroadipyl-CoA semialdehyde dehydrogenase [Planctomycetota bacterium]
MTTTLTSYVQGAWHAGSGDPRTLYNATTEEPMATVSSDGIDFGGVLAHARDVGGPALRGMTFEQRGAMLKALSGALHEHREELLDLSAANAGTTRKDGKFDIDGATGTLAAYAYFAKECGPRTFLSDGDGIQLGRTARFWGQHIYVPKHGAAVHINAFNFPAWNMFEKAACSLLAGVPVIEKPGTATAMVAWRMAQIVVESGLVPEGGWQFIAGSTGDLLDKMGPQDVMAFTGSAWTANKLRSNPNLIQNSVRVNIEADSLNATVLGPDVEPGSESWNLFLRNVVLDMQQKTGQKCTAIRRVLVPQDRMAEVTEQLVAMLGEIVTGDPTDRATTMGPLASAAQLRDVREGIGRLAQAGRIVCGGADPVHEKGYFVAPTLLEANSSDEEVFHRDEVFGPVATLLPYSGAAADAAAIVARGEGSLVGSLYSNDTPWVEEAVLGMAPWHGRLWVGSDRMAEQSLPPGMVLPAMVHGGPGRAGGGEELGGVRGILFYMQRTAVQGFKGQVHGCFGKVEEAKAT